MGLDKKMRIILSHNLNVALSLLTSAIAGVSHGTKRALLYDFFGPSSLILLSTSG